jgi:hypothetical protein
METRQEKLTLRRILSPAGNSNTMAIGDVVGLHPDYTRWQLDIVNFPFFITRLFVKFQLEILREFETF